MEAMNMRAISLRFEQEKILKSMLPIFPRTREISELEPKLKKLHLKSHKILSLPTDVVALAVANNCELDEYVDFHTTEKITCAQKSAKKLTKKLNKIFN